MPIRRFGWTEAEIALIGTMPDSDLAQVLNRSEAAVQSMRRWHGIRPYQPHFTKWTKLALSKLGTMPDAELAKKLGCARLTVLRKRQSLGIAPYQPKGVSWKCPDSIMF